MSHLYPGEWFAELCFDIIRGVSVSNEWNMVVFDSWTWNLTSLGLMRSYFFLISKSWGRFKETSPLVFNTYCMVGSPTCGLSCSHNGCGAQEEAFPLIPQPWSGAHSFLDPFWRSILEPSDPDLTNYCWATRLKPFSVLCRTWIYVRVSCVQVLRGFSIKVML